MAEQKTKSVVKRIIGIGCLIPVLAFVIGIVVLIIGIIAFEFSFINPKTSNVFDQLYHEVRAVKYGRDSVLVSGTETAWVDYDFGEFDFISIPDLDMFLDISEDTGTLHISFHYYDDNEARATVHYSYKLEEKQLYGERPLDYLVDNFLNDYFEWYSDAEKNNPYSQDNLGKYSFELRDYAHLD